MPLALWGLEAAYHQSLSDGCLQFGVWLEAWFFLLLELSFYLGVSSMYIPLRVLSASRQPGETPRHSAPPSLLCPPDCRENMVGADVSMLDLEWL